MGQAQGFDRPDVCVAFTGGVLTAGPLSATVGGLVARVRNVDTDFEHLAAHLTLEISGRLSYRGESNLAGLEVGRRPPDASPRGFRLCAAIVSSGLLGP